MLLLEACLAVVRTSTNPIQFYVNVTAKLFGYSALPFEPAEVGCYIKVDIINCVV